MRENNLIKKAAIGKYSSKWESLSSNEELVLKKETSTYIAYSVKLNHKTSKSKHTSRIVAIKVK